ncbi:uncharacterized protein LOC129568211 isoform X2 [Sitodiplosis mosellana]|uniref:uncharacterized protein LOC129568211 isoform X2 n=1 Tax=Sitodiplosis mosellana TaxID=263140 RepID=UPI002443EDE1|nr:uncharacterized protein LOC129568211 isoform X2 [Sitodiplosis mosellana]
MGEWTDAIAVLISNIESETKFTLSNINDDFKHSNPPFDYNFREKLLNLINRRVCKVYDEFVLYLELKRLNGERKLSAKDDAIASFADWEQSTGWKVIPSQKRKNQDEIDTGNQTFLIKRPRFEVYEESSGDSSDEEIFEISDEETDLFDKENLISTNSVAETTVQSSVEKIAGRPSESKLAKSTDYRKIALAFTPIDNGNQITAESFADRVSSQRLNRILTQTSTPLPVPTKSVQPSIASIGNRDSSSTPVSSRITSSISPTSSHIPPLAPKTRVAPATALTEPSKLESDTSTTKDVSPAN